MAIWHLVDIDKLNRGLSSIANALRDNSGGPWEDMSFPDGFTSYIFDYVMPPDFGGGGASEFATGEYVFDDYVTGEVWIEAELGFVPDFWIFRPSWAWTEENDAGTLICFNAHMQHVSKLEWGESYGRWSCEYQASADGSFYTDGGKVGEMDQWNPASCIESTPNESGFPIKIPEITGIKPWETYVWAAGRLSMSDIDDGAEA